MLAISPSNSVKIALSLLIQNNGISVHLLRQPAFVGYGDVIKVKGLF